MGQSPGRRSVLPVEPPGQLNPQGRALLYVYDASLVKHDSDPSRGLARDAVLQVLVERAALTVDDKGSTCWHPSRVTAQERDDTPMQFHPNGV